MTRACRVGLALLASAVAIPAAAQDIGGDARCFIAANLFAKAEDARAKEAAERISFFYLGRLRGTPAQIDAAIRAQARTVTQQNAATVMQACARTVQAKVQELRAIGQRLSQQPGVK